MSKKIKKRKKPEILFGKKEVVKATKTTARIPFHLDDKGRRVFDLDKFKKEKQEQEQRRKENNKKIKINATLVCNYCGLAFTDNMSYQEHINSKQHNKIVGNNMNIKEVTVNTIKEKLLKLRQQREELKEKQRMERVEKNIKESNFIV
jgi:hypothetical protein